MLPRNHPDRIQIAFDDHRLVANAGGKPSSVAPWHDCAPCHFRPAGAAGA